MPARKRRSPPEVAIDPNSVRATAPPAAAATHPQPEFDLCSYNDGVSSAFDPNRSSYVASSSSIKRRQSISLWGFTLYEIINHLSKSAVRN